MSLHNFHVLKSMSAVLLKILTCRIVLPFSDGPYITQANKQLSPWEILYYYTDVDILLWLLLLLFWPETSSLNPKWDGHMNFYWSVSEVCLMCIINASLMGCWLARWVTRWTVGSRQTRNFERGSFKKGWAACPRLNICTSVCSDRHIAKEKWQHKKKIGKCCHMVP